MNTCRHCGAEILWARTTKGRWMPYDVEPVTEGVRFVLSDDPEPMAFATVIGEGHMLHPATCPNMHKSKPEPKQGELDL